MLILTSCEHKDYFAFDDVSFVRNFPNKYVLGKADTLDVELIGIHGVKSFGDYLLVSCSEPAAGSFYLPPQGFLWKGWIST